MNFIWNEPENLSRSELIARHVNGDWENEVAE